MSIFIAHNH